MDRDSWKQWITYPTWRCPTCDKGSFRLDAATMQRVRSRAEDRAQSNEETHNSQEDYRRFVGLMRCDHPYCGETGTIAGNHLIEWYLPTSEPSEISYEVLSVVPAPLPFPVDKRVPGPIKEVIREAAALFWGDHKAAANRAREVIEAVLTDLGVTTLTAKGKDMRLSDRINEFTKLDAGKYVEQAEIISAAKTLGDAGTHDTITREETVDAFEMLELVLQDIYVRTRQDILEKVRKINAEAKASLTSTKRETSE